MNLKKEKTSRSKIKLINIFTLFATFCDRLLVLRSKLSGYYNFFFNIKREK